MNVKSVCLWGKWYFKRARAGEEGGEEGNGATANLAGSVTNLICCF